MSTVNEQSQITNDALKGGFKADDGKARLDLFPVPALRAMSKRLVPGTYSETEREYANRIIDGYCDFWTPDANHDDAENGLAEVIDNAQRLMAELEGVSQVDVVLSVGELYALGAKKYADRNWEKGMDWGRCFAAGMRHMLKLLKGETHDQVDGQHHLTSVIWCALALQHYFSQPDRYSQFDTRKMIIVAENKGQK